MGVLKVLGDRAIRGEFFDVLEDVGNASWVPAVAHMFDSDVELETHAFLGHVGPLEKRTGGPRRRKELKDFKIEVRNEEFIQDLAIKSRDLRREKTNQIMPRVGELATRAAQLPEKVITDLIEANANSYDGIAYYGDHSAGRGMRINNIVAQNFATPDDPTSAEMSSAFIAIVQRLLGAKDDTGEPGNTGAREFLFLVPTLYWGAGLAALTTAFTSAGVSNLLPNIKQMKFRLEVNDRLAAPTGSAGKLYGYRTDGSTRAVIWQDEVETELSHLGAGSTHHHHYGEELWGVERVGNGALAEHGRSCRADIT